MIRYEDHYGRGCRMIIGAGGGRWLQHGNPIFLTQQMHSSCDFVARPSKPKLAYRKAGHKGPPTAKGLNTITSHEERKGRFFPGYSF